MFEHGICLVLQYVDHLGMGVIKQQDDTVSEVLLDVLNEGITMCLEIKYYNISVRQHNLIIYL